MTMATQSKYQDKQLDALLNDLIVTLEKHKTPVDLSLMALGNMVSNILITNIANPTQRQKLAETFNSALLNAIQSSK